MAGPKQLGFALRIGWEHASCAAKQRHIALGTQWHPPKGQAVFKTALDPNTMCGVVPTRVLPYGPLRRTISKMTEWGSLSADATAEWETLFAACEEVDDDLCAECARLRADLARYSQVKSDSRETYNLKKRLRYALHNALHKHVSVAAGHLGYVVPWPIPVAPAPALPDLEVKESGPEDLCQDGLSGFREVEPFQVGGWRQHQRSQPSPANFPRHVGKFVAVWFCPTRGDEGDEGDEGDLVVGHAWVGKVVSIREVAVAEGVDEEDGQIGGPYYELEVRWYGNTSSAKTVETGPDLTRRIHPGWGNDVTNTFSKKRPRKRKWAPYTTVVSMQSVLAWGVSRVQDRVTPSDVKRIERATRRTQGLADLMDIDTESDSDTDGE